MADGVALGFSAYNTVNQFSTLQRQASASSAAGQYAARVDEQNAKQADAQSADALLRGQAAVQRRGLETRQQIGSTRAAMAAQGVDVSSGSAADVQSSEAAIGKIDETTLRNNAAREAWGYQVEGINDRLAGKVAAITGDTAASGLRAESFGSLLSGAANTYNLFNKYRTDRQDLREKKNKSGKP